MHQSCLLLTSREMPGKLEPLQGKHSPVRALKVFGLGQAASQELLKDKELFGTPDDWDVLVHNYAGNPLTLQMAAATVRDVFGGSIVAFLHESTKPCLSTRRSTGNTEGMGHTNGSTAPRVARGQTL